MVHNIDEVKKGWSGFNVNKKKILISFILYFIFLSFSCAKENYYDEAKKNLITKIRSIKILFQKNIVFNPKDAKSYLYLQKYLILRKMKKKRKKFRYNFTFRSFK